MKDERELNKKRPPPHSLYKFKGFANWLENDWIFFYSFKIIQKSELFHQKLDENIVSNLYVDLLETASQQLA